MRCSFRCLPCYFRSGISRLPLKLRKSLSFVRVCVCVCALVSLSLSLALSLRACVCAVYFVNNKRVFNALYINVLFVFRLCTTDTNIKILAHIHEHAHARTRAHPPTHTHTHTHTHTRARTHVRTRLHAYSWKETKHFHEYCILSFSIARFSTFTSRPLFGNLQHFPGDSLSNYHSYNNNTHIFSCACTIPRRNETEQNQFCRIFI